MRKIFYLSIIIIITFLLLTTGCLKPGPVELTYSIFLPSTHVQYLKAEEWAREIEKRTNNQVKIKFLTGSAKTRTEQYYDGVVNGISDIGMGSFAATPGRFPLLEGLDLPVGYPDGLTASQIANEMVLKYQPVEVQDTHVLYLHAQGSGLLATKKPVNMPADLKGMRIRASGLSARIVKSLGGVPLDLGRPETYAALQTGNAEGIFCPMETLAEWKLGEVINWVTDTSVIGDTTVMFVVMNKSRWDKLPQKVQRIFTDVSAEWVAKHGAAWDQADAEAGLFVEGLGKKIITPPGESKMQWQQAVQSLLMDYLSATSSKNLPGTAFLADIRSRLQQPGREP